MSTPNDITKLPKWAQQHIALLERNLETCNRKLGEFGAVMEYNEPGIGYDEGLKRRKVPGDSITLANSKGVRLSIRVNRHDQFEANVNGYRGRMVIYPEASNHFCVGDSGDGK